MKNIIPIIFMIFFTLGHSQNKIYKEKRDFILSEDKKTLIKWLNEKTTTLNIETQPKLQSVTHIGEEAFIQKQLRFVDIPDHIESIGSWAFANNLISEITLPKSLTTISEGLFIKKSLSLG